MRILILGGTGFIGPFQVRYALERGHQVTVFNRGTVPAVSFSSEVEQLVGDREGKLDALAGREWDVVIDNPTTLPAWVRDVAQVLQGHVHRYIFISTIAVYADVSQPGQTERGRVKSYTGADPMLETMQTVRESKFALYGPLKALAEQEAEKWFPGQILIIRPGLIVGPGDWSDRFTYWPVRLRRGGKVLAPPPDDPAQIIDVRDLAEWTIRMAETQATGIYNATGPAQNLTFGDMLGAIQKAVGSDAEFVWADTSFLASQNVAPWSDLPVWVPPASEMGGFTSISNQRALGAGLTFRPLSETTVDTLTWFRAQSIERQKNLKAGLKPEREAEVIETWGKSPSG